MRSSTLLFDLDDTLVKERSAAGAALVETAAEGRDRHGADPESIRDAVLRRAREIWWRHPKHDYALSIGVSSWEALWARFEGDHPDEAALRRDASRYRQAVWTSALADVGVHDPEVAATMAERFPRLRRARHEPFPESAEVLRALRESGRFRFGLITNGLSCLQREKLRGSGLERYFDVVTVGGDIGSRKPRREVFEHTLGRLDATAGEAVMIGNNPKTDIAGARAAGIDAILVHRDAEAPPADHGARAVIRTLFDLPSVL